MKPSSPWWIYCSVVGALLLALGTCAVSLGVIALILLGVL